MGVRMGEELVVPRPALCHNDEDIPDIGLNAWSVVTGFDAFNVLSKKTTTTTTNNQSLCTKSLNVLV